MDLQLTDDETRELRLLLDSALSDLRMESADTDNPEFRRGLHARRDIFEAVLARLPRPVAE